MVGFKKTNKQTHTHTKPVTYARISLRMVNPRCSWEEEEEEEEGGGGGGRGGGEQEEEEEQKKKKKKTEQAPFSVFPVAQYCTRARSQHPATIPYTASVLLLLLVVVVFCLTPHGRTCPGNVTYSHIEMDIADGAQLGLVH